MLKRDKGSGAKPTEKTEKATKKKKTVDLDGIGRGIARFLLWLGQAAVEVLTAFALIVSVCVYALPMSVVFVGDVAGMTYESPVIDYLVFMGLPGVMLAGLYIVLICKVMAVERRLLDGLRDAAVGKFATKGGDDGKSE